MNLFLPETIVVALVAIFSCLTLGSPKKVYEKLNGVALFGAAAVLGATLACLNLTGNLFSSSYRVDLLSQGFKFMFALSFGFVVLFSKEAPSIHPSRRAEYYLFLSTALLGMMMLASAVELLTLFVAMELSSYSLYLLASLKQENKNPESSVKYLLFGAATSGIFLWGVSLVVGLAGTTSLLEIAARLNVLSHQPAFILGLVFASFAFLFKLSGAPMHFWAPDVYECASTQVTTFIATASKAAAVALFVRFFILAGMPGAVVVILGVLAFTSMTLGNCVALVQKDTKRLLAYSSIAQAGYILTGLLSATPEGYSSSFFYALAYVLMNTGAFLVVLWVGKAAATDNPLISDFDGLADRSGLLALLLLLSLLSLAGIPPLMGFTGKWILFSAAMDKGHWFLVLWGVLNSVVSLFYYLTIVKHAYLEKPKISSPIILPMPIKLACLALICAIISLGLFPNPFITLAQHAISSAMPL